MSNLPTTNIQAYAQAPDGSWQPLQVDAEGRLITTASSASGGATPGLPALSVQGASADGLSLIGIPNSSFDPVTGDVTLGAGFLVNNANASGYISLVDTNGAGILINESNPESDGGLDIQDAGTGIYIIETGNGHLSILSEGTTGIDINSAATGSTSGTGPISLTSAGGVFITDNSTNNIIISESGNSAIAIFNGGGGDLNLQTSNSAINLSESGSPGLFLHGPNVSLDLDRAASGVLTIVAPNGGKLNGNPILTALVGTTSAIGGSALTLGQQATGTVSIAGASAAIAAGAVVQVTPTGDVGNGFVWTGSLTAADTITVKVICLVAGTPASNTFNVKVF